MVWTCYEERPREYRKKGDGNGITAKEENREAEKKISECSEGGYEKVSATEKEIVNRRLWRNIVRCGYP